MREMRKDFRPSGSCPKTREGMRDTTPTGLGELDLSNQLRQVKLRSHWLVGVEEANVRLGRSPTVRNVAIVDVQGGAKTLEQAMTVALRRYAKANKTNVIALKVVSLVWKRGAEVKTYIDVYGDLKTLRETQPAK